MIDVQGRTETAGYAINAITRCASKVVGDVIVTMMAAYEDDGVGEVEVSVTAWAGSGKRDRLGGRS